MTKKQPKVLTRDQLQAKLCTAYRATTTTLNATISLGILPTAESVGAVAQQAPAAIAPYVANVAKTMYGPANFLMNQFMTFITRAAHEDGSPFSAWRSVNKQPQSADQRYGVEAQGDYLAEKIMKSVPVWRQGLAARTAGIGLGLRQNFVTQFAFNFPILFYSTLADGVGYVMKAGYEKATGKKIKKQRRFQCRNTVKALLMNLGTIAPAGDNLQAIVDNSRLPAFGRVKYERDRIAASASARQAFQR